MYYIDKITVVSDSVTPLSMDLPHLRSQFLQTLLDTGNLTSHPSHVVIVTGPGRKMLPLRSKSIRRVLDC